MWGEATTGDLRQLLSLSEVDIGWQGIVVIIVVALG
jgi:hypothetical protein